MQVITILYDWAYIPYPRLPFLILTSDASSVTEAANRQNLPAEPHQNSLSHSLSLSLQNLKFLIITLSVGVKFHKKISHTLNCLRLDPAIHILAAPFHTDKPSAVQFFNVMRNRRRHYPKVFAHLTHARLHRVRIHLAGHARLTAVD